MCRICHPESAWIDELNPRLKELERQFTPEQRTQRAIDHAREAEERLKAEIQRAQDALAKLQDARVWLRYHDQLTDEARKRWESWGIPAFYQEFWKLGFDPDRVVFSNNLEWHTPTMTIPVFSPAFKECLNVRHRLLNPPRPGDKYRPERAGLPAALFIADPDEPVMDKTLLVEGEKKAMVSFVTADDPFLQVVGIPGKNPSTALLTQLRDCDPVYICLDPDATRESINIASALGAARCRIIELPDKIDDLIINHQLDKSWIKQITRQAVKA